MSLRKGPKGVLRNVVNAGLTSHSKTALRKGESGKIRKTVEVEIEDGPGVTSQPHPEFVPFSVTRRAAKPQSHRVRD